MIDFLKYTKIYFLFSLLLILASIACLVLYGLNFGIEFSGGSVLTVEYLKERPSLSEIKKEVSDLDLGNLSLHYFGDKGVAIRMKEINEKTREELFSKFQNDPNVDKEKISYQSIGGVIGRETKNKAKVAIFLSIGAMIFYIAFAFRRVSRPIRSWEYGIATVIALIHDVLIPVGVISALGRFLGVEFSIPILTALLTIFGYSVNDTVVVFDRIRENLIKNRAQNFHQIVNRSLNQTLVRSVNTSFTTLLVLFAIFFFASPSLKYFSLTLIIGIASGTYSSIFLASPLLVYWFKRKSH
jgi:preprotein translocase subunit SecF